MGGGSAPKAPDYVGAAQAQGVSNKEVALYNAKANNPNIVNPYGTQSVSWQGDYKKGYTPTLRQNLSPAQQKIFDAQNAAKRELSYAGVNAAKNIHKNLASKINFSKLPGNNTVTSTDPNKIRNDAVNAMMSRVDNDTTAQRNAKNSELIAAGIRPGTAAYDAAMTGIDRQYNDARQQAILAGGQEASRDYAIKQGDFGMSQAGRNQAIFEMMQQRQVPINEINALLSGSQVNSPFAGGLGYQPGTNAQSAPMFGAVQAQGQAQQNQYNQQQAQQNSNINAGAGLVGSLGSAFLSR